VTFEDHFSTVATLCAQLARSLLAIAEFLFMYIGVCHVGHNGARVTESHAVSAPETEAVTSRGVRQRWRPVDVRSSRTTRRRRRCRWGRTRRVSRNDRRWSGTRCTNGWNDDAESGMARCPVFPPSVSSFFV